MCTHRGQTAGRRGDRRARGFLSLDVALSIGLTALLAVAFAAAFRQCASAERLADRERELRVAAETELLHLRAAGLELAPGEPSRQTTTRTPDGVVLETTMRPGAGVWSGLTRVAVVARGRFETAWLRVELAAYIPPAEVQP